MAGNVSPDSSRPSYVSNHKRAFILAAAAIVALTGIAFAFFHMGKSSSVAAYETAATTPMAARVDQVDGDVGIAPEFNGQDQNNVDWLKATVNSPVSVGDRIYVRDSGKAGIAFGDRSYARLDSGTMMDIVTMTDQRTQVALRDGSATFDCGGLRSGDFFEVETPDGAVDFKEPGLYQIAFNDSGHAVVTVLSGQAEVIGQSGSTLISKGETLTLAGTTANETNQAVSSRLSKSYAGSLVNDYYQYRSPRTYDGRYVDYDAYLSDPFYFEPYHRYASYKYFDDDDYIAGIEDLDTYGTWENIDGYGNCWHPNVEAGWAPYNDGYWATDYPWGLTWVSQERWGWAPYHYGRWGYINNQWAWIPGPRETRQVYAPALVAFVSIPERQEVGWVPLGPGDRYIPRYYNNNWQAQFVAGSREVAFDRTRNFNAPGAVTVVNVNNFNRRIDRSTIVRTDPGALNRAQFSADPFAVASIRQRARDFSANRQRVTVPADVQARAFNRPVVASQSPILPPSIRNNAQAMRVERVNQAQAGRRLQVNNSSQVLGPQLNQQQVQQQAQQNASRAAAEQQRQQRITQLSNQAANGDRQASIQLRQLRQHNATHLNAAQTPVVPVQRMQQDQQRQQQINADRTARQQSQAAEQQQRLNTQREAQQQQQLQRNQQMEQQRQAQQQQRALRNQQREQQRQQQARPPQAQPRPMRVPTPQAQPQPQQAQPRQMPVRPPQAQPRPAPVRPPQAQPRPAPVRPPQAQPKPQQQAKPPAQAKPNNPPAQQKKKGPGGN